MSSHSSWVMLHRISQQPQPVFPPLLLNRLLLEGGSLHQRTQPLDGANEAGHGCTGKYLGVNSSELYEYVKK
jgi:hypothetical protein